MNVLNSTNFNNNKIYKPGELHQDDDNLFVPKQLGDPTTKQYVDERSVIKVNKFSELPTENITENQLAVVYQTEQIWKDLEITDNITDMYPGLRIKETPKIPTNTDISASIVFQDADTGKMIENYFGCIKLSVLSSNKSNVLLYHVSSEVMINNTKINANSYNANYVYSDTECVVDDGAISVITGWNDIATESAISYFSVKCNPIYQSCYLVIQGSTFSDMNGVFEYLQLCCSGLYQYIGGSWVFKVSLPNIQLTTTSKAIKYNTSDLYQEVSGNSLLSFHERPV